MEAPRGRSAAAEELDEVTLERARRKDPAAARALVERYHRPVHALLFRMTEARLGAGRADDLAQETFLRVFRGLGTFRHDGTARLSTWIFTIATRVALNELRKGGLRTVGDGEVDVEGGEPADAPLERRELGETVRAAVARLSDDHRAVVVLREYHGMSYEEIGEALEVDVGTVRSRLSRARALLRQMLEEARHG